jgi:hypothetical protein
VIGLLSTAFRHCSAPTPIPFHPHTQPPASCGLGIAQRRGSGCTRRMGTHLYAVHVDEIMQVLRHAGWGYVVTLVWALGASQQAGPSWLCCCAMLRVLCRRLGGGCWLCVVVAAIASDDSQQQQQQQQPAAAAGLEAKSFVRESTSAGSFAQPQRSQSFSSQLLRLLCCDAMLAKCARGPRIAGACGLCAALARCVEGARGSARRGGGTPSPPIPRARHAKAGVRCSLPLPVHSPGTMKKFGKRRASLSVGGAAKTADMQEAQRVAVALQKDYLAIVQGEQVVMWPSQMQADCRDASSGVEVTDMEEAKECVMCRPPSAPRHRPCPPRPAPVAS